MKIPLCVTNLKRARSVARRISPERLNHSLKPLVAPKPNHLSTDKSFKASRSKVLPTTPDQGHKEIQLSNNEACLKNGRDSRNELLLGPQVQRSNEATRVPVLPVPHPFVRSSPVSPPELPPRPGSTSPPGIHQSETKPPLPPKPLHSARQREDLKVSPPELRHSLTLRDLADNHSKSFPIQVQVAQGFYGLTSSQTVNSNDT